MDSIGIFHEGSQMSNFWQPKLLGFWQPEAFMDYLGDYDEGGLIDTVCLYRVIETGQLAPIYQVCRVGENEPPIREDLMPYCIGEVVRDSCVHVPVTIKSGKVYYRHPDTGKRVLLVTLSSTRLWLENYLPIARERGGAKCS